jgi:hypothetical protein
MPACHSYLEQENVMFAKERKLGSPVASVEGTETRQDNSVSPRMYHTPELHDVGKAVELVQGGGGGNYLDANRSRYY